MLTAYGKGIQMVQVDDSIKKAMYRRAEAMYMVSDER